MLIQLYDFSLLFLDLSVQKKAYQKYKMKISQNSCSGHFKLPFDNTILVNKKMFRFNKTTLKIITKKCLLEVTLLTLVMSLLPGE